MTWNKAIKAIVVSKLNEKYDAVTDDLLNLASLVDPQFRIYCMKDDMVEAKNPELWVMLDEGQITSQATLTFRTNAVSGDGGNDSATPAKM